MSRRLPWIVSFLGLGLAACAVSPTGQPQLSLVSPAQEVEMGRQLSREIEQKVRLVQDPVITGYVERVGQRLAAVSDWREIRYHFKVVDAKEVNAFALPGGYIYIHKGLLEAAANEAELASVLGHEIGHVAAHHPAAQLSLAFGAQLIATALLGQNPALWGQMAAQILGGAGLSAYGRSQELEADALGIRYLARTGYDPQTAVTFLEKLLALGRREPGAIERFFASHPPTAERVARARRLAAQVRPAGPPTVQTAEFEAVKARLRR
ncbi:MAG: M48 family metalloprotease [Candidatus Rokubacteria bacterium]|nr:M48 family metalloprotease [Candidatus Rokubacteria bacterium]